jgi:ubiquinol oxidase
VAYYFILIAVWATSPTLAYNFSELIEAHAVDTYTEFAESNKELLQSLEAPAVAKEYYENADLYIFDEFQTDIPKGSRRPEVNSLYEVFLNIRDDEAAHVSTMNACQNAEVNVVSSNTEAAIKKILSSF